MASLPVPGTEALPTAAAAKEQSQFNACEVDKKIDAKIKKEILDAIAAGQTCVSIDGHLPDITRKELKKLKYKIKERAWDGFTYYVVSWG